MAVLALAESAEELVIPDYQVVVGLTALAISAVVTIRNTILTLAESLGADRMPAALWPVISGEASDAEYL